MGPVKQIDRDGHVGWGDSDHRSHRDEAPAQICESGVTMWFIHGQPKRADSSCLEMLYPWAEDAHIVISNPIEEAVH